MRIGAHVPLSAPLAAAHERGADVVQLFLSPPQSYKAPKPRDDAEELRAADLPIFVHAPYVMNPASTDPRIRHPARKTLAQTLEAADAIGAAGVVVHPGHVGTDDDIEDGFRNWRKGLERLESRTPILIENTAGGDNAVARYFDRLARLWEVLDGVEVPLGVCLDTCHTHAAGENLATAVERIRAIAGSIDLVHLNDSKDAPGSGRDRHQNLGHGTIDPDLLVAVVREAGADVIVETPGEASDQAADITWIRGQLTASG